jgi:hypothetical protein
MTTTIRNWAEKYAKKWNPKVETTTVDPKVETTTVDPKVETTTVDPKVETTTAEIERNNLDKSYNFTQTIKKYVNKNGEVKNINLNKFTTAATDAKPESSTEYVIELD